MIEELDDAKQELKRVDHQIYVSLKYTRTVDVLLNIISRMIDAYDLIIEALLKSAKEKNKIEEIPTTPKERGELLKKTFESFQIHENVDLYFLLKKILKSSFERSNEYRRHVTLTTYIDGRQELVNIDIITKYYHFMIDFLNFTIKFTQEND